MIIQGKVQAVNERTIWLQNGKGAEKANDRYGIAISKVTLGKSQLDGSKDFGLPAAMSIGDLLGKTISLTAIPRDYSFKSTNQKNRGQEIKGTTYYVSKITSIQ